MIIHVPSAVGQDVVLPRLELVCAADGIERCLAGFESSIEASTIREKTSRYG